MPDTFVIKVMNFSFTHNSMVYKYIKLTCDSSCDSLSSLLNVLLMLSSCHIL